jgi:hypothetical protein
MMLRQKFIIFALDALKSLSLLHIFSATLVETPHLHKIMRPASLAGTQTRLTPAAFACRQMTCTANKLGSLSTCPAKRCAMRRAFASNASKYARLDRILVRLAVRIDT